MDEMLTIIQQQAVAQAIRITQHARGEMAAERIPLLDKLTRNSKFYL